jgi:hypothetical protein
VGVAAVQKVARAVEQAPAGDVQPVQLPPAWFARHSGRQLGVPGLARAGRRQPRHERPVYPGRAIWPGFCLEPLVDSARRVEYSHPRLPYLCRHAGESKDQKSRIKSIDYRISKMLKSAPKIKYVVDSSPKIKYLVDSSPKIKYLVDSSPKIKYLVHSSPKIKYLVDSSPKIKNIKHQNLKHQK